MPKVPTYDSPQAQAGAQPFVPVRGAEVPDVAGQQSRLIAGGLKNLGGAMNQIAIDQANEANALRTQDATNQAIKARTDLQLDALKLQGRNALERPDGKPLPDEYAEKLKEKTDAIAKTLGNDAQRKAFQVQSEAMTAQMRGTLSGHMMEQQKVFQGQTWKSTLETAVNQGVLLYGDESMRKQSTDVIRSTIDQMAEKSGWDKATKEAAYTDAVSPLHAGVMKSMITGGNASQAKEYYDQHSAEMSVQARATLQPVLKQAGDAQTAEQAADAVWAKMGPRGVNGAVNIFDMEKQVREDLKGNPDAMKLAISGLRERTSALNAQQSEQRAQNVSGVWKLVDQGTGMRQVMRSEQWLSLSGTEQHEIRKSLEAEAATRSARGASEASRQLSQLRTNEQLNFMRNGDLYLTASNPDVLKDMTRAQVEAKRTEFGMEATQHLLNQWDNLQKPGRIGEARMDAEDFNMIADKLGLKPFAKSNGEEEKRALGSLKYRIEQVIDQEQQREKRPLSRQEKSKLMQEEMTKQVLVDPGFMSRNKNVPVIQLTNAQVPHVVISPVERQTISAKMEQRYQATQDPRFAPTEENLRFWYLRGKSPAASTLSDQ